MMIKLRNVLINNPEKSSIIGTYSIIILVTLLLVIFSIDINSKNYLDEEDTCGIMNEVSCRDISKINDNKIDVALNKSFMKSFIGIRDEDNYYQDYYNNYYQEHVAPSPVAIGKYLWNKFKPTGATLYLIMSILIILVVYIADYEVKVFMKDRATLVKYLGIKGLGDINKITF